MPVSTNQEVRANRIAEFERSRFVSAEIESGSKPADSAAATLQKQAGRRTSSSPTAGTGGDSVILVEDLAGLGRHYARRRAELRQLKNRPIRTAMKNRSPDPTVAIKPDVHRQTRQVKT